MFVDADFGKSKEKPVHDGPLPRSKDAMRQISTKPQTSNGELQGEYHRVALHAKVPARARQMAKDTFEELIDYIRSVTGTEVKFRDLSESEAHRVDDVRTWDSVNLRCTSCRVDCGLCGAACCVYENARRTVAKAGPGADGVARERAAKASQMIKVIEISQEVVAAMYVRTVAEFVLVKSATTSSARWDNEVLTDVKRRNESDNTIYERAIMELELFWDWPREQLAAETASTQPPNANRQQLVSTGCASPTFKMRTYDDSFSGQKIYPGKGKLYVRGDSKIFRFQNGKSESLFLQRKNPRRIAWTVLFRRQHKKGISEEVAKKRTRRVVKHQRAVVGASLDVIKERRNQRPEARAAARQQAIKEAKEKKAANESRKKAEKAKLAASGKGAAQRIQSKQGAKGSAPKVAAKSR
ncbi:hypothetical protein ATERTT37_006630 [Aspergillus terreus]